MKVNDLEGKSSSCWNEAGHLYIQSSSPFSVHISLDAVAPLREADHCHPGKSTQAHGSVSSDGSMPTADQVSIGLPRARFNKQKTDAQ